MVNTGIQDVVEVKRPHGVHSESPGSLLVSPTLPSHASVDLTAAKMIKTPHPQHQRNEENLGSCLLVLPGDT